MKNIILAILVLMLGVTLSGRPSSAQADKIRVMIEAVGDHSIGLEIEKYMGTSLELLEDVEIVEDDPQVYVHIIGRRMITNKGRGLGFVMAAASSVVIELTVELDRTVVFSDYGGLWLEAGPDLRSLCEQCVVAIDSGVLNNVRTAQTVRKMNIIDTEGLS